MGALSCEHIEFMTQADAKAMRQADTVGVLLPGAYYFLKETTKPPVQLLRQEGVKMAIATDCNPGSSPTTSLRLMMNMACQFFGLSVTEALLGVTQNAAQALGLSNELGSLEVGKKAELLRWPFSSEADLCYTFGSPIYPQCLQSGAWKKLV